jgi:FAD:protein FMN transferase
MITRARPLLGTLVSIRANAPEPALRAAFDAVERVHRLMNAHADSGDLAAINRDAHRKAVRVDRWTFRVLRLARAMSRASEGAFDPTLGRGASHEDIVLQADRRVRLRRAARLDLGGIAKGFAVDCAVAALRRQGATTGCVNAGGDLRVFGDAAQVVHVRLPACPQISLPLGAARERAFATSGAYFGGELLDARSARRLRLDSSITVSAVSCAVADALTKVIATLGPQAALLRRFGAEAFLVDARGMLYAARG